MRAIGRGVAAVLLTVSVAIAGAIPAHAAPRRTFRVSSPAFAAGGPIPGGFTCDGENASPPLRWRGVPKRAAELALVMEDPDTAIGTFVHWVAWGIDPAAGSLPEQVVPAGVQQGANGTGQTGYRGPCPPPGAGAHHYRFTLYAVDAPIELSPGASADDLRAAVRGHVVGRARLVGLYERGTG